MMNKKNRYILICTVIILGIITVFVQNPIPQDSGYHLFSDQQTIFGIFNFWNVASNLLFLLAGLFGLNRIQYSRVTEDVPAIKSTYQILFFSIILISLGSGYYHIWPNNDSLVWDRLPMTMAFMALFSIIISEFVSIKLGKLILWPLLITGIFSVFYWQYTENNGAGDLRMYILVQFLPMLIIPIILLTFKSKHMPSKGIWILLVAYLLAKLLEYYDEQVHSVFILSGHSLKHIVAALGLLYFINTVRHNK